MLLGARCASEPAVFNCEEVVFWKPLLIIMVINMAPGASSTSALTRERLAAVPSVRSTLTVWLAAANAISTM